MSDEHVSDEHVSDGDRSGDARPSRRLRGALLVLALLLCGALAGGVAFLVLRERQRNRERRAATEVLLAEVMKALVSGNEKRLLLAGMSPDDASLASWRPPIARGELGDESGQKALARGWFLERTPDAPASVRALLRGEPVLDGWGNPLLYRCPGRIHEGGWDLYSLGPDGIDQQGGGDDVVAGLGR